MIPPGYQKKRKAQDYLIREQISSISCPIFSDIFALGAWAKILTRLNVFFESSHGIVLMVV